MTVKIATDSLSDIPREMAEEAGLIVVPLNVHFGDEVYKDGVEISADELYRRLPQSDPLPKTSQPSPGEFADVYRRALAETDAILSLHASSKLSGTYNSALLGREQVLEEWRGRGTGGKAPEIVVVDTQWASMALGILALTAARGAREGAPLDSLTTLVTDMGRRTHCAILMDTLEYLAKGGRIGKAQSLLGSLLSLKPLLQLRDGEVHPMERIRTTRKARQRLHDTVARDAPLEALAVLYTTSRTEAQELAERLRPNVPSGQVFIHQVGPVIGVYAGPGCLAAVWVDLPA